ncbi:MAG: 5-formyltetrahydrofolate cyclo-ligase [Pseudobutyrivibrio sp.]|nr:5-formyltetrahydrofolate cyclo-ligase [Pseudobutyrivibrio sp.]
MTDRKQVIDKILRMDSITKDGASKQICLEILSILDSDFPKIREFLCFYPMASEPDIRKVYEVLLERGNKLYFPVTHSDCSMDFFRVDSLEDFEEAAYHVMEPVYQTEDRIYKPGEKTFCFTPGVVFDKRCNRMGHGKGFYDRFFANNGEHLIKAGVAFEIQITDGLQIRPWDVALDFIFTEKEIYNHA